MPGQRFDDSALDPAAPAGDAEHTRANGHAGGPEAVHELFGQLEEFGEYARLYLQAKRDLFTALLRRFGLILAVALVALVVVGSLLAAAAVLSLVGLSWLIGDAMGRPWAGYLITGGGLLVICFGGMWLAIARVRRSFYVQTVEKYARRHEAQRQRFGHDVRQRAAGQDH